MSRASSSTKRRKEGRKGGRGERTIFEDKMEGKTGRE